MSYDVTPAELFDELKKEQLAHYESRQRIAELEAELEHIRKRYKLQGQHLLQKDDENQRLRKALEWYRDNDVISGVAHKALEKET